MSINSLKKIGIGALIMSCGGTGSIRYADNSPDMTEMVEMNSEQGKIGKPWVFTVSDNTISSFNSNQSDKVAVNLLRKKEQEIGWIERLSRKWTAKNDKGYIESYNIPDTKQYIASTFDLLTYMKEHKYLNEFKNSLSLEGDDAKILYFLGGKKDEKIFNYSFNDKDLWKKALGRWGYDERDLICNKEGLYMPYELATAIISIFTKIKSLGNVKFSFAEFIFAYGITNKKLHKYNYNENQNNFEEPLDLSEYFKDEFGIDNEEHLKFLDNGIKNYKIGKKDKYIKVDDFFGTVATSIVAKYDEELNSDITNNTAFEILKNKLQSYKNKFNNAILEYERIYTLPKNTRNQITHHLKVDGKSYNDIIEKLDDVLADINKAKNLNKCKDKLKSLEEEYKSLKSKLLKLGTLIPDFIKILEYNHVLCYRQNLAKITKRDYPEDYNFTQNLKRLVKKDCNKDIEKYKNLCIYMDLNYDLDNSDVLISNLLDKLICIFNKHDIEIGANKPSTDGRLQAGGYFKGEIADLKTEKGVEYSKMTLKEIKDYLNQKRKYKCFKELGIDQKDAESFYKLKYRLRGEEEGRYVLCKVDHTKSDNFFIHLNLERDLKKNQPIYSPKNHVMLEVNYDSISKFKKCKSNNTNTSFIYTGNDVDNNPIYEIAIPYWNQNDILNIANSRFQQPKPIIIKEQVDLWNKILKEQEKNYDHDAKIEELNGNNNNKDEDIEVKEEIQVQKISYSVNQIGNLSAIIKNKLNVSTEEATQKAYDFVCNLNKLVTEAECDQLDAEWALHNSNYDYNKALSALKNGSNYAKSKQQELRGKVIKFLPHDSNIDDKSLKSNLVIQNGIVGSAFVFFKRSSLKEKLQEMNIEKRDEYLRDKVLNNDKTFEEIISNIVSESPKAETVSNNNNTFEDNNSDQKNDNELNKAIAMSLQEKNADNVNENDNYTFTIHRYENHDGFVNKKEFTETRIKINMDKANRTVENSDDYLVNTIFGDKKIKHYYAALHDEEKDTIISYISEYSKQYLLRKNLLGLINNAKNKNYTIKIVNDMI